MKRKLLIFSALISLLLAGFQFTVFAEEDIEDSPSILPIPNSIRLDSYFFDNYDLLPYVESNGNQTINSGINASSNLRVDASFSFLDSTSNLNSVYGSGTRADNNSFSLLISHSSDPNYLRYYFSNAQYQYNQNYSVFDIINTIQDRNHLFVNNQLIYSFNESSFTGIPIYIFDSNSGSSTHYYGKIRLYNLSIYDYSANDNEGGFVAYYYPAKSKSSGTIGLYDAVSDTFITTSGSIPFISPVDDLVLNLQIGSFLTAGIGWIGHILEFAVETPIIMIFMAIGLAGAMFRWSRRLIHF